MPVISGMKMETQAAGRSASQFATAEKLMQDFDLNNSTNETIQEVYFGENSRISTGVVNCRETVHPQGIWYSLLFLFFSMSASLPNLLKYLLHGDLSHQVI